MSQAALVMATLRQALVAIATLPDCDDARRLHEQCRNYQALARAWDRTPPTSAEREQMMRDVLALHVAIARLRRKLDPPR